jgi:hypothetical protein
MEIKIRPPADLIKAVDERTGILEQIETAAGMKGSTFNDFYMPLIRALAEYVLECPLERYSYAEPGGALRFGLTASMFALRHTATRMFASNEGSERRRILTEQYKFAAFAASIASVPAIVHTGVLVSAGQGDAKQTWSPYHAYPQLDRWLNRLGSSVYLVSWKTDPTKFSQSNAVAFSADIFKSGTWQYFDPLVVTDMFDAIAPSEKSGNEKALWHTVKEGQTLARELEKKAASGPYIPSTVPNSINATTIAAAGATPETITAAVNGGSQANAGEPAAAAQQATQTPATAGKPAATTPAAETTVQIPPDQAAAPETAPEQAAEPVPENPVHVRARELLKSIPEHLAETLYAIRKKPDFERLKETWIESEEGLDITVMTLRELGRAPTLITEDFKKYGLIVRGYSSTNPKRTGLILKPEVAALIRGEVDAFVQ